MEIVRSLRNESKALLSDGKGPSLAVIAGGWGLLLGTRMIYPVLLPHLRASFDLSLTVAGLLVTVLWLGSAVGQLPGGVLADRYSERVIMGTGAVVAALALVVVVTAPTTLVLFLATGLVGLGQSLYPIARITLLSKLYPDRIGSALGVTMATGDLGQTVVPPLAGALAAAVAWQLGLGVMIPALLLVGAGILTVLPADRPTGNQVESLSVERVRRVLAELRGTNTLLVTVVLFMFIFVWQSFTGFYPTYLVEEKGLSSTLAGVLFSSFFACGIVVKPLAGSAYDRIGLRGALILVLVGPVGGLVVLPFVEGFWPLVGVTILVSTMLGSGAVTQSFLAERISKDVRGTGLGVIRTVVSILGAAGPVVIGVLADHGYFDEGMLLLGVVTAGVVLLTLRLPRS